MKFEILSENEYNTFLNGHEQENFLNSPNIGKIRKTDGWDYAFLGVKNIDNKIIGATMLLSRKEFLNKKEFYAIRGFILDYNDFNLLSFFTKNIKKYIKENNGFILRIDPYLIKQERDINGAVVQNGQNNLLAIDNLLKLGFKEHSAEQSKWMFELNTQNKTMDELLKDMKANTRNHINRTFKNGVNIRELDYDDLPLFYKITNDTSERKGFKNKTLEYYQDMYKFFKPNNQVKFLVAELNTKDYKENLDNQLIIEENVLKEIKNINSGKYKDQLKKVDSVKKNLSEANTLIKKGNTIILSAAMFIMYGNEVIYFSSGNYQEYFNFFAQYRIQYEMIKYAAENNFKIYNFYGISGNFDTNDDRYGVYEFKKGFGGFVVELIGEYRLDVNKFYCVLYGAVNLAKKTIKKIINRK